MLKHMIIVAHSWQRIHKMSSSLLRIYMPVNSTDHRKIFNGFYLPSVMQPGSHLEGHRDTWCGISPMRVPPTGLWEWSVSGKWPRLSWELVGHSARPPFDQWADHLPGKLIQRPWEWINETSGRIREMWFHGIGGNGQICYGSITLGF